MILLLGGTADSRAAASVLLERGYDVLLSVVSGHAADIARRALGAAPSDDAGEQCRGSFLVRVGALDEAAFTAVLREVEVVVDSTHPFAEQISALALAACDQKGVPYIRLERPSLKLPKGVMTAPDASTAARLAVDSGVGGCIFATVGTRTLHAYVDAARAADRRLVARVMPTVESVARCFELGLPSADIVAMQGPASPELDAALLRHLGATVLVTKESGEAGGLTAKLEACRSAGVTPIVVMRPQMAHQPGSAQMAPETVTDVAELPSRVANLIQATGGPALPTVAASAGGASSPGPAARSLRRGLLQVYTGDGKGKTTAAVGLALRARGRGLAVAVVQFVKGGAESGELAEMRKVGIHVLRPASKRTGLIRGEAHAEDRRAVEQAWQDASELLASGAWDMVILDELHAALRNGLIEVGSVLQTISSRPDGVEVVTTGRGAPAELVAAADLVTEMLAKKHPYPGIAARRGIEY